MGTMTASTQSGGQRQGLLLGATANLDREFARIEEIVSEIFGRLKIQTVPSGENKKETPPSVRSLVEERADAIEAIVSRLRIQITRLEEILQAIQDI